MSHYSSPQKVQSQVKTVLRWFNQDDELVDEVDLENTDLAELQRVFCVSDEDPMYDCYLVETEAQQDYLEKRLNTKFDTNTYDYFVERDYT